MPHRLVDREPEVARRDHEILPARRHGGGRHLLPRLLDGKGRLGDEIPVARLLPAGSAGGREAVAGREAAGLGVGHRGGERRGHPDSGLLDPASETVGQPFPLPHLLELDGAEVGASNAGGAADGQQPFDLLLERHGEGIDVDRLLPAGGVGGKRLDLHRLAPPAGLRPGDRHGRLRESHDAGDRKIGARREPPGPVDEHPYRAAERRVGPHPLHHLLADEERF